MTRHSCRTRSSLLPEGTDLSGDVQEMAEDAASAGQSMQDYAAVNGLSEQDEIATLAYQYFREREQLGSDGNADGDWFRAEAEVLRRKSQPSVE